MRLSFDDFEIDTESKRLWRGGEEVALERRALELLCYLASHPGRLVSKDELLSEVWQAQSLSDGVLTNAAAKLRRALGQAAGAREPIETVRGLGYRWRESRREVGATDERGGVAVRSRTDPFVGRGPVLEVLERALDQAARGSGQFVQISGDAGVGKTRTLDELAARARDRGFSVWEGAAYDGGGAPAYWPWAQILRAASEDLSGAMFRRHLAADSWAMSLIVPELIEGSKPPASPDAEATRFRLFDEVARFITSACAETPRMIAIDDVQWADDGTVELAGYLARTLKKRGVLLAITTRPHDPASDDARASALARVSRRATPIVLAGLSRGEVSELVIALGEARPSAALSDALFERTQGNPFFVRQMLELLVQRGQRLESDSLESLGLPPAVRGVLQQRVGALGAETRGLLRTAAAVGAEFDASLLAEVRELPLPQVLAALEPACRSGVVVPSTTPHRFCFGHALLRESIYDELELLERGELHARIGRALERQPVGDDPRQLGEIARHALLAVPSELEACVRHCRSAANAARKSLGFATAAELLAKASDKIAREAGDGRTRCELLTTLSRDRFCAGDIRDAWRALEQSARLAERIGAVDHFAESVATLAAWLELGGGDELEIRALLDRALAAVGDSNSDLRAELLARRAEIWFELPALERDALLDEADRLAARHDTPSVLLALSSTRASLRDPTRIDAGRRAVERYRELDRAYGSAQPASLRLLQHFTVELGEYLGALTSCELDVADAALHRCRRIAEESQVIAVALGVELMQAGRALGDGRLDDLSASIQRLSDGSFLPGGFAYVWQTYAFRLVEAQGALQSLPAAELPSDFQDLRPSQRMNATIWLARFNAKVGGHALARRQLAGIPSEQLARMPVRYGDLGMLCFLAEVYVELEDSAAAEALYAQLLPHAALNSVGPAFDYGGAVAHYLGALARLLGREAEAARHFEHAVEINRKLRMPLQLARSQAMQDAVAAQ